MLKEDGNSFQTTGLCILEDFLLLQIEKNDAAKT